MTSYVIFTPDLVRLHVGGYSDCLAFAQQHCERDPQRVAYVGRLRAGEPNGQYVYEVTCDGYKQVSPRKFFRAGALKRDPEAGRRSSYE